MLAAASRPASIERFFQISILGLLTCGFLALAGSERMDWIGLAALLVALVLRAAVVAGLISLRSPNRIVFAGAAVALAFYLADATWLSGSWPPANVHLAALLAALKIVTARSPRDYIYLKLIAVMELVAAAVFAVNLGFFILLALFLLFGVATLASGEVRHSAKLQETVARAGQRGFSRRLGLTSVVLCASILTMTGGLFFVLPRAARGALSRFAPDGARLPGFAESVSLGEIGRIQQSSRVVLHARADRGENLEGVRWRGGALTHFDGVVWSNPHTAYDPVLPIDDQGLVTVGNALKIRPGREVAYKVQLDEITSDTLFFAGIPETIRISVGPIYRSAGGAFHVKNAPGDLSYRAFSYIEDERAAPLLPPYPLSSAERSETTQLPEPLNPRIAELALSMVGTAVSDEAKARALESHLKTQFGYTLDLPSKVVADPLSNFLFVRKKGHCEYFASAMAVMLRTLGIPSRVVTGFQSGVFNPLTGWRVVRASDAHSWVEAWLEGSGWTVFDPTPFATSLPSQGVLARLSLLYDAADQFWQDWVLRYDLQRQIVLAAKVHQWQFTPAVDPSAWWQRHLTLVRISAIALMAATAIAIVLAFFGPDLTDWWRKRRRVMRFRRGEGHAADATLLYQRMLALLARRGFQKPSWLTPSEFARVLPPSEMAVLVEDLTAAYNELRFGGQPDAAPRLIRMLDRLESIDN